MDILDYHLSTNFKFCFHLDTGEDLDQSKLYFYTLYGHLSSNTLEKWSGQEGTCIKDGEIIGQIGDCKINGGTHFFVYLFPFFIKLIFNTRLDAACSFPGDLRIE